MYTKLVILLFAMSTHMLYAQSHETRFKVSDNPSLIIHASNGRIEVKGTEGLDEIVVRCIKKRFWNAKYVALDEIDKITAEATDEGVKITENTSGRLFYQLSYEVEVPINTSLELRTSAKDIVINDISGEVNAETNGGDIVIDLEKVQHGTVAKTSGGKIEAKVPLTGLDLQLEANDIEADLHEFKGDVHESKLTGRTYLVSGKMNGGGPKIDFHTAGGEIILLFNN